MPLAETSREIEPIETTSETGISIAQSSRSVNDGNVTSQSCWRTARVVTVSA